MNSLPVYNNRLQTHRRSWYSPTLTVPTTVKQDRDHSEEEIFSTVTMILGWDVVYPLHLSLRVDSHLQTNGTRTTTTALLPTLPVWLLTTNLHDHNPAMPGDRLFQFPHWQCRHRRTRARVLPRHLPNRSVAFSPTINYKLSLHEDAMPDRLSQMLLVSQTDRPLLRHKRPLHDRTKVLHLVATLPPLSGRYQHLTEHLAPSERFSRRSAVSPLSSEAQLRHRLSCKQIMPLDSCKPTCYNHNLIQLMTTRCSTLER